MRDLLDPRGRWVGRPGRRRRGLGQTGSAPVALDDALTVFRGQGPIVVPVLANDIDPEGGALTLISASAALCTATANGDGTVTYAAPQGTPPGAVTFDTVTYEIADADDNRDTARIDITITGPVLSVDVTLENTLTVTAAPDPIEITVTEPAVFVGTYQADLADLMAGPVNLVAPEIIGTEISGTVLTATEGLWIHDLAAKPVARSWQWRRGGTAIPGETGTSYTLQASDIGAGITAVETLNDSYGARSAASGALALGFQPDGDAALLGWWDANDAATITDDGAGLVSTWADKVGGAPLGVPNSARSPQTDLRTLNGRNVLNFDGDDFLERGITLPASGDVAIHMALIIDSVSSALEAIIAFDATNDIQIDANATGQFDGRLNATGIGSSTNLTGGPFSGALILSAVFNRTGGQAEIFIGNVSRGTMAYTQSLDSATALHVLTNRSRNAWVDGAVAELIITGDVASRADYHGYLATKWGLS